MKIIYIINSLKNGGPVNMLYTLIKYIDKRECEVIVVALKKSPENNTRDFSDLECKVTILENKNVRVSIQEVQKIIDNEHPDIVHSHGGVADIVNSRLYGSHKSFSTVHCDPDEDFSMKSGKILGWIKASVFLKNMKKIKYPIACSKTVSNKIKKKRNIDIRYVRNGIDLDKRDSTEIQYKRADLGLREKDIVLVFCGYLSSRKNVKCICDAIRTVKREDISILVIGNGTEYQDICEYGKEDSRIRAIGRVNNAYQYLRACDYFISASKSEGLPLAVMEGMSCGLPAFLSDIESHREVMECCPKGVELFTIDNTNNLVEQLNKLKKPSSEKMEAALSAVEEYLNAGRMAAEYLELYKNL